MANDTSKSGFHMLQSPIKSRDIEDDEDDPSPSQGTHIGSSDAAGTQATEIHRKRAGQRRRCNSHNEPASDKRSRCQQHPTKIKRATSQKDISKGTLGRPQHKKQ